MNTNNTICAIATAPGGALGIIRVSGRDALTITDRIFQPVGKDKRPLQQREPYTLAYGKITDKDSCDELIDEVLVSVFRSPHSYTGEDSVEISCHGSSYIMQRIIQLLMDNGCKAAAPGEYTQRAFLNGKMDLSQAEAVADLISSNSAISHRVAMNQMRGAFSKELSDLRDKLLHLTSLLELELDFSDHEELEFADRSKLINISTKIKNKITKLTASFKVGSAIKNGVPVAIVGETNAGKSTLMNQLVGDERAIVSDIHGTTRDVIEDTVAIDGINFRFIDTAGIRDTNDKIETIGINRTMLKISQAEIVLIIIDSTLAEEQLRELAPKVLPLCDGKSVIIVMNKTDIATSVPTFSSPVIESVLNGSNSNCLNIKQVSISAKTGDSIPVLQRMLCSLSSVSGACTSGVIVSNLRHLEALKDAQADIDRVLEGFANELPSDIISQDLRSCLYNLGEITGGEIRTDEVLGNIFKHFCVGK